MEVAVRPNSDVKLIVSDSLDRVADAIAQVARSTGIDADGPLRQAYELRWRDHIDAQTFTDIGDLWRSGQLILEMSRPPRSEITSRFVDLARHLDATVRSKAPAV